MDTDGSVELYAIARKTISGVWVPNNRDTMVEQYICDQREAL